MICRLPDLIYSLCLLFNNERNPLVDRSPLAFWPTRQVPSLIRLAALEEAGEEEAF